MPQKARWLVLALMFVTLLALGSTWAMWLSMKQSPAARAVVPEDEYHAVYLVNGLIVYAKLERFGSAYPVLRDVYYVRNERDEDAKQMVNHLIKRGQEWHGPDRMVVNAQHILFVEPVSPDSRIAALIRDRK